MQTVGLHLGPFWFRCGHLPPFSNLLLKHNYQTACSINDVTLGILNSPRSDLI
uniref:Uncharacterized protein n=1 Tax=Rhizophora mucronata TaxID=61149 RepID=A0A2P2PTL5_RHIMU